MSLLTPLFVLGALAVGLPLLFHLIQRRPKGEVTFSSLMFLSPSPPRITRRSRLDNLLLLLLRGLALILLALAFGRPFLRSSHWMDEEPPARRLLVLVDTSASMRRGDLWEQAQEEIRQIAEDLRPTDEAALYAFDADVRSLVSFIGTDDRGAIEHDEVFAAALNGVGPSHAATDLGSALATAADLLHTSQDASENSSPIPKQIVLVTDLQQGSDIEMLRGYAWPEEVHLDIRRVETGKPTNARAIVVSSGTSPQADVTDEDGHWRVTVVSAADSVNQQFRLGWADREGRMVGDREHSIQVPPGGSRAVRLPMPPAGTEAISLTGDDQPFDNTVYVVRPTQQKQEVLYLGADTADDSGGLLYYLARAAFDDASREVTVKPAAADGLTTELIPRDVPLVVIARPIEPSDELVLRAYVENGGKVLLVLTRALADPQSAEQAARRLVGDNSIEITEATVNDYAMLAQIDFTHTIFQPFADARFNDFTKIPFWSHRQMEVGEESPARILARFDSGSAALVEYAAGEGRVWVLAAGWQPQESRFALSSKFIPVLAGMLQANDRGEFRADYAVGEPIELPADHPFEHVITPPGEVLSIASLAAMRAIETPQPTGPSRPATAEGRAALAFDTPGVYVLHDGQNDFPIAVNVAVAESRTAPLDLSELESTGVGLGKTASVAEMRSERRRLRDFELERGQRLWQWLLVGVLVLLGAESWLAGRLSRRPIAVAPT